jgi:hypothetical protein
VNLPDLTELNIRDSDDSDSDSEDEEDKNETLVGGENIDGNEQNAEHYGVGPATAQHSATPTLTTVQYVTTPRENPIMYGNSLSTHIESSNLSYPQPNPANVPFEQHGHYGQSYPHGSNTTSNQNTTYDQQAYANQQLQIQQYQLYQSWLMQNQLQVQEQQAQQPQYVPSSVYGQHTPYARQHQTSHQQNQDHTPRHSSQSYRYPSHGPLNQGAGAGTAPSYQQNYGQPVSHDQGRTSSRRPSHPTRSRDASSSLSSPAYHGGGADPTDDDNDDDDDDDDDDNDENETLSEDDNNEEGWQVIRSPREINKFFKKGHVSLRLPLSLVTVTSMSSRCPDQFADKSF